MKIGFSATVGDDLLPTVQLPSLVLVACKDEVFPLQGPVYVGEAIPGALTVFFEESSHALFFDEPEKFNEIVACFILGSDPPA